MNTPVNYFGSNLRALRENAGLSSRHVAIGAGISPTFYSDIEYGRRMPSRAILENIAKALDLPPSMLFKFDPRESIDQVVAELMAHPENGPTLAKLCKGLGAGRIKQRDIERLSALAR
jgi:transcriptional regulator with XRE-family HTH domain